MTWPPDVLEITLASYVISNFTIEKHHVTKARTMQNLKKEVIDKFHRHESDTGSPEVQIALISQRIVHLGDHFKAHVKDHQTRRSLLKLVGQRRRLLGYLKSENTDRYKKVTKELGLRK